MYEGYTSPEQAYCVLNTDGVENELVIHDYYYYTAKCKNPLLAACTAVPAQDNGVTYTS